MAKVEIVKDMHLHRLKINGRLSPLYYAKEEEALDAQTLLVHGYAILTERLRGLHRRLDVMQASQAMELRRGGMTAIEASLFVRFGPPEGK